MKSKYTVLGKMKVNEKFTEFEKIVEAASEQDAKDIFEEKLQSLAENDENADIESIEILEAYELSEEKDKEDDDYDDSEDKEDDDKKEKKTEAYKKKMKESLKITSEDIEIDENDLKSLFKDQEISEDFINGVKDLFQLHVVTAVNNQLDKVIEQVQESKDSEFEQVVEALEEKIESYLQDVVVEEWINENELVLERSINNEILEDFVLNLHECFKNHYVQVPDEQVDKVSELMDSVEELENKLDKQVTKNLELSEKLEVTMKENILERELSELPSTTADKIRALAENLAFKSEEDFREKVVNLKENYSPSEKSNKQSLQMDESVSTDSSTQTIKYSDIDKAASYMSRFK